MNSKKYFFLLREISQTNHDFLDIDYVKKELTKPHVTLQLIYDEYTENTNKPVSRSSFYNHYRKHLKILSPTLKLIHKGGEKLFVDYSGDSLMLHDSSTRKTIKTQLFVCCFGASSYCYAEATLSQNQEDFTMSHVRAFEFFKCIPKIIVPDNLKSAVIKANRYNPQINKLYGEMAEHYDIVIEPARVRKPKDKAVVESNVLHIQRYILSRLRNQTFFSLRSLNNSIHELLIEFNKRPMKDYGNKNRTERFYILDKPHCRSLPKHRFEITKLAHHVLVNQNYHVRFEKHNYSVPNQHIGKRVDVYLKGNFVEIYFDGVSLCRHLKGLDDYGYSTNPNHQPTNHKYYLASNTNAWAKEKMIEIGKDASLFMEKIIDKYLNPESINRAAKEIFKLSKLYDKNRVNNACRRSLQYKSTTIQALKSILEKDLDKKENNKSTKFNENIILHKNIRGYKYYKSTSLSERRKNA